MHYITYDARQDPDLVLTVELDLRNLFNILSLSVFWVYQINLFKAFSLTIIMFSLSTYAMSAHAHHSCLTLGTYCLEK